MAKKRVAVIGAGPSGLAQLRAFQSAKAKGEDIPDIVCYEKQADWGGLWNYTWRTGVDENGNQCHGSMYRYLWSNGPKEGLEFADYSFEEHFGKPIASSPPRAVLFDYIEGRVRKAGVRDWIRFNTIVRDVRKVEGGYEVTSRNEETDSESREVFDHVVVATGSARHRSTLPGADQRHVFDGDDLRDLLTGLGDGSAAKKVSVPIRAAMAIGRRIGLLADPGQVARLSERYMPVGKRVVIIGGGLVGAELAEFLLDRAREVTVLEAGEKLALEMAHPRRWRVLGDLRQHGAELCTGVRDIVIERDVVRWETDAGVASTPADTVVIATLVDGDRSVADRFAAAGIDPIVIGDADGIGYLEGAIHAGWHTAAGF